MSFADLVATAAVGTSQRPVPSLPGGLLPASQHEQSPAVRLLDAAAAYAVVRRAHLPTHTEASLPAPAPADPRPEPPERFVAGLARHLGGQPNAQPSEPPGATSNGLVAEALGWIDEAGWRLPDRMLIPVLQRVARSRSVARAAPAALGGKGLWLASLNPDWTAALRGDPDATSLSEAAWHEGSPPQRLAYLRSLRRRDPDAARRLLSRSWSTEPVDERVAFAELLAGTAQPSDEAFLVAALADRSKRVAEAARPGLLRIPGSALLDRLRERARQAVSVRAGVFGRTVQLEPPPDDAEAMADGLSTGTYSRTPAESRLNALVASIPPRDWPELVGVPAAALLTAKASAAAAGSWTVVPGLVEAAVRWGDGDLAGALVDAGIRTPGLLTLLSERRVVALLGEAGGLDATAAHTLIRALPKPWSSDVAAALGGWLQRQLSEQRGAADVPAALWEHIPTAVPALLARGWAGRLRGLADDARAPSTVQRRARAAAGLLTLRAAMYDDVRAATDQRRLDPVTDQEER